MNTPNKAIIIDGYRTKNLNKASYLCLHGAVYRDCILQPDNPIAIIVLDGVNLRHRDTFWADTITVELWTFIRVRQHIKDQIHAKIQSRSDAN